MFVLRALSERSRERAREVRGREQRERELLSKHSLSSGLRKRVFEGTTEIFSRFFFLSLLITSPFSLRLYVLEIFTMADSSISLRPLSLGPMTLAGPQGRNPFASFAKGAGAGLNPAGAAAVAPSTSAPREERKKKNPADIVSYDTEFLMGFAKVRECSRRACSVSVSLSLPLSCSNERERERWPARKRKRNREAKRRRSHRLPAFSQSSSPCSHRLPCSHSAGSHATDAR